MSESCLKVRQIIYTLPQSLQKYAAHSLFLPHIFQTVSKNHLLILCYEIYIFNALVL